MALLEFSAHIHVAKKHGLIYSLCSGRLQVNIRLSVWFWKSQITRTFDDILNSVLFKVNHNFHVLSVALRAWGTGPVTSFPYKSCAK